MDRRWLLVGLLIAACSEGEAPAESVVVVDHDLPSVETGYVGVFEPGEWRATEGDDPASTSLTIMVILGGCRDLDKVEVTETDREILVDVTRRVLRPQDGYGCHHGLSYEAVEIPLREPLGARQIPGQCDPTEDSVLGRQCPVPS